MEQPPGRGDDLQPQDLSTSSIPTVIDLTRKGEECLLNATSMDAVRQVKSPAWYQNSVDAGRTFLDTDSINQSGERIQPDDAFSHTTVTLSYVSRSHVFSTQDSVSRHSSLCSVQPISRLSLHPSQASNKGLQEGGFTLSQQLEEPVNLTSPPDLLLPLSQDQDRAESGGTVCPTQKPYVMNGGAESRESEGNMDCSASWGDSSGLENSQTDGRSSPGVCVESSPELLAPAAVEDKEQSSEVLLLRSKTQDSKVMMDSVVATDTCSINRDYTSPLEDTASPSATSLYEVEDVIVQPRTSFSPSVENSYQETTGDSAVDGLSPDDVLQSSDTSTIAPKEDWGGGIKHLTEDEVSEDKLPTVLTHMNGAPDTLHRTLNERKLPVRSTRGKRLEAIVMNINSSRCPQSGCIRSDKKAGGSSAVVPQRVDVQTLKKRRSRVRTSLSVKDVRQRARCPLKSPPTTNMNTDSCSDATSDSTTLSIHKNCSTSSKCPPSVVERTALVVPQSDQSTETTPTRSRRTRSSQSSPRVVVNNVEPSPLSTPEPSPEKTVESSPPPLSSSSKSPKNRGGKAKVQPVSGKKSPATKTKTLRSPQKRRRKKPPGGCSSVSMFSPKEPEIKLKYVNYREEKKDQKLDSFSPFVHIQRQELRPSLCTVVNYPEEVRTQTRKGQQQSSSSYFGSTVVPSTSCLQLGRVSTRGQHQRALVCCLCGRSANTMDLGDLHGPYYPEGYQPSPKTPANTSGLKEDDSSDSDSSSCNTRGGIRRGRCAPQSTPWSIRAGAQLQSKVNPENQRWSDSTDSPLSKRPRLDTNGDWYNPPLLPQESCEYWLHEDCGIWSAGVFLVKGKVYGLEEAVKTAQEMMCSACQEPGATLGCFFRGCSNKYHYRCALESDCVLIEDNFSMKCKKHKNKTIKGLPGSRHDDS